MCGLCHYSVLFMAKLGKELQYTAGLEPPSGESVEEDQNSIFREKRGQMKCQSESSVCS